MIIHLPCMHTTYYSARGGGAVVEEELIDFSDLGDIDIGADIDIFKDYNAARAPRAAATDDAVDEKTDYNSGGHVCGVIV
jgi:hypothetical protein